MNVALSVFANTNTSVYTSICDIPSDEHLCQEPFNTNNPLQCVRVAGVKMWLGQGGLALVFWFQKAGVRLARRFVLELLRKILKNHTYKDT